MTTSSQALRMLEARSPQLGANHDPKTEVRKISSLLAQEKSKDRQTPQPGNIRQQGRRRETRTRRPVLQARRLIPGAGFTNKVWGKSLPASTDHTFPLWPCLCVPCAP